MPFCRRRAQQTSLIGRLHRNSPPRLAGNARLKQVAGRQGCIRPGAISAAALNIGVFLDRRKGWPSRRTKACAPNETHAVDRPCCRCTGLTEAAFSRSAAYSPPSTLASGGHLDACSHGAMPIRRKTSRGAGFLQMIWKLSATLSRATGIPGKAIQAGTGRPNKARTVVRAATSPC